MGEAARVSQVQVRGVAGHHVGADEDVGEGVVPVVLAVFRGGGDSPILL